MKHHQHSIGWKRANRHDVPMWKEFVALASCYVLVIGLVCLAFFTIR